MKSVNYVFFLDGDSMIYMLGWSDISLKELKERIGNKHIFELTGRGMTRTNVFGSAKASWAKQARGSAAIWLGAT